MAVRRDYRFRARVLQYTDSYTPAMVWRQSVVPGQSLSFDMRIKLVSAEFSKYIVSEALFSVAAFYVPYRLVWDQWIDFITQGRESPAITVPKSSASMPEALENFSSQNYAVLGRRCFKLAYNSFFGSSRFGGNRAYYNDITNDVVVGPRRARTIDQFASRTFPEGQVNNPTFPVANPINLNDFYRSLMQARSQRFAQITGDKYVDAMRRMGVELDWRVQQAPELLQVQQLEVRPVISDGTGVDNLGMRISRHEGTIRMDSSKRYRFAEHGLVFLVGCYRPVFFQNVGPSRPRDVHADTIHEFFLGDNVSDFETVSDSQVGGTGAAGANNFFKGPMAYTREGANITPFSLASLRNSGASGAPGLALANSDDDNSLAGVYIDPSRFKFFEDDLPEEKQVMMYTSGVTFGRTPVPAMPPNVLAGP